MMDERSIAVLGMGRMGSAIAEALMVAGHKVTVWNRTPEKTHSFDGRARVAASVVEACRVSDVTILCVLNYDSSDALLRVRDVKPLLAGKTLVQLSSGTPARAREAAAWAASVGFAYLDRTFRERISQGVASRNYPSGNASMTIWRAWAEQFVQSEVDAGVDLKVPQLLRDYMIRA